MGPETGPSLWAGGPVQGEHGFGALGTEIER